MKILLIEDSLVEASYLLGMFRSEQEASITIETSLADGIAAAKREPYPDVVLLDLMLPDSLVEATLPRFIEECPGIPVFITTGTEDIELAKKLGYLGAAGYALKRTGPRHILHLLACAIGATRRDQEIRIEKQRLHAQLERFLDQIKQEVTENPIVPTKTEEKTTEGHNDDSCN